jgi:hypothetical protein
MVYSSAIWIPLQAYYTIVVSSAMWVACMSQLLAKEVQN